MTNSPSPTETLNKAIKKDNPFQELVVKKRDVWGKGLPDLPSLNAHASDAVFEAIEQISTRKKLSYGITVKAEKGLGKSHLISRIRNRVQAEDGSFFVYMSDFNDLNQIKPEFLKTLAFSLKEVGSQGVRQWRQLATALVNEVMNKSYAPEQLVKEFSQEPTENYKLVDNLTTQVLGVKPEIENPDLIQAILWTLSSQYIHYATNWLAGKNLPQSKADKMGLPSSSEEEQEAESFDRIRQIIDLIGNYTTLVICFDELDYPDCNDAGFTRAQVVAGLGKDLYNSVNRAVLLAAMYPETWMHQVQTLPYAEAVVDRIGERVIDLKYLNSDEVISLVSQWLKEFYENRTLTPPHSVYPFDESKLREFGKEKPTVRKILKWCQENWTVDSSPDPVEAAFQSQIKDLENEDLLEEKAKLAKALIFGFNRLVGNALEGVKVERIETTVSPKQTNKRYIDFKVIGKEQGQKVKIGVGIIQDPAGAGIQAGLSRLVDYEKYDLTRGCLVRSKSIPQTAKKAQEYKKQLLEEKGGEWVHLKKEEVNPLIAIQSVYDLRDQYDLSEEQIFNFVYSQNLAVNNPVLREILSDPSGQVPEEADDEEDVDIPNRDESPHAMNV